MAEILESFTFYRGRANGSGESRYDKWLDGRIYRLSTPEDIPNPTSGAAMLRKRAKANGLKVATRVDGSSLIVQAYEPEAA